MAILRGRSVVLLTYAALAIHGLAAGGSGFLFLFTLQLDLMGLIILYGLRPDRVRGRKQPDAMILFAGSIPLILINYVLAVALGLALDEYPDHGKGTFLERPASVWGTAMIILTAMYTVAIALDRIHFNRDEEFWSDLPSRMAIKGTLLALLGYIGFGILFWLGQENSAWVISCLVMVRIALEYVLKPLPGPPRVN